MQISKSSGYIGLGSRLFLSPETSWSILDNTAWKTYNIYNQAGARPQKVTTPIEVSQLYPSMLRRKPIKNSVSVEGSYTFSLPTVNSSNFWELLTGNVASGGSNVVGTDASVNQKGTRSQAVGITLNNSANQGAFSVGNEVKISKVNFATGTLGAYFDSDKITDSTTDESYVIDAIVGQVIDLKVSAETFVDRYGKLITAGVHSATELAKNMVTFDLTGDYMKVELDLSTDVGCTTGLTVAGSANKFFDNVSFHGVEGDHANFGIETADIQSNFTVASGKVTSVEYGDGSTEKITITTNIAVTNAGVTTTDAFAVLEYYYLGAPVTTTFDVDFLKTTGSTFDLAQVNNTSFSFAQSIGLHQISLYTGMMAQSATFNVSPDDVANVEVSFLGANEELYDANLVNTQKVFGDNNTYLTTNSGSITGTGSGMDNCTEFYPSWATSLYINRKIRTGAGALKYQKASGAVDEDWNDATVDQAWGNTVGDNGSGVTIIDGELFQQSSITLFPFSDLSVTVNNSLETPAYINGSKTLNQPVQTTYKEVSGSITLPYNQYTRQFVKSMFEQDSFEFRVVFELDASDADDGVAKSITLTLPEVCIAGDSLADIPEGELTLPINFVAYASKDDVDGEYDDPTAVGNSPFVISLGGNQS